MGELKVKVSQSDERLNHAEDQNLEKDRELALLRTEKSEAVWLVDAKTWEVASLRSADYKECIIADFQKTGRYKSEIEDRATAFFGKGVVHAIRQLHHLVPDKKLLVEVYNNSFEAEGCKKGADFVPLQGEELEVLQAFDSNKGLPEWVPPAPAHPTFWELQEAASDDADVEEVAVAELPDESGSSSSALAEPERSDTPANPPSEA